VRCVRCPPNRRNTWFPGLFALGMAGLPFASGSPARLADEMSFVYCLRDGGAKVFAGTTTADGGLIFGVSVWSPAGQNISVFGVAARTERGWRFTEDMGAAIAAERCGLNIERGADGSLRVSTDPDATCQSHGGVNAGIGEVRLPRAAYEGAVTTELDNPEAFQRAGKCARAKK
jgi:hypothetical protein